MYLLEPFGRNTAAAVALAALWTRERVGADAPMLVLPADHLIHDEPAFARAVAAALPIARDGMLVTFGIEPSRPETGYGYIECDPQALTPGAARCHRVVRFVEKPQLAVAQDYVASGRHLWNSGMFCFTAGADPRRVRAATRRRCSKASRPCGRRSPRAKARMLEIDPALFAAVPDISIDYAVMEKAAGAAPGVAVVRGAFDWSDIGSWQALSDLVPADALGNRGQGERVAIDTRGTLHPRRGPRGRRRRRERPRHRRHAGCHARRAPRPAAAREGRRRRAEGARTRRVQAASHGRAAVGRVHRAAGSVRASRSSASRSSPGAALSLQMHHRRSEHWVVVSGIAEVTCGEAVYKSTRTSRRTSPSTRSTASPIPARAPLVMIEVQCGDYLGEDDIVRFDDRYGRVPAPTQA